MKERQRPRPEAPSSSERASPSSGVRADLEASASRATAEPSVLAGRYELVQTLGRGAFAVTHRARDRRTDEDCVVKEVLSRKVEDPKTLELLEREARVLAHLRHPRIPRFVEFFSEEVEGEKRLFLVQGYVPGKSLAEWAREGRHWSEREVVGIARQVARILAYLHDLRPPIIHRDVKPGNVVVDPSGEAWLVDFGAVRDRILDELRTETDAPTVVGTYGYMPFEQFQGRASPASDVYALGMTLVFLLTHKEPYEIESVGGTMVLEGVLHASPGLARVVEKMVAPKPEDRYASASELCAELEALVAAPSSRPRTAPARRPALLGVAALAVAGLVGFGVMRAPSPPAPSVAAERRAATAPVVPRPPAAAPARVPPAHVETLGLSVAGRLTYDGQPLESITDEPARFWLRHEGRGEVQPGTVRYQGGQFWLGALPPGKIGAQVNVDLERSNPPLYPGDLYRWKTFDVGPAHAALEIDLWKIIRLRAPQDNNAPLSGWSTKCEDMFTTDSRQVAWDPVADGVVYEYTIEKVECPYVAHEAVRGGTTAETSLALTLPPTGEGHFYLLRLYAKRGDRRMAQVLTHGVGGGLGWDYRFRLR